MWHVSQCRSVATAPPITRLLIQTVQFAVLPGRGLCDHLKSSTARHSMTAGEDLSIRSDAIHLKFEFGYLHRAFAARPDERSRICAGGFRSLGKANWQSTIPAIQGRLPPLKHRTLAEPALNSAKGAAQANLFSTNTVRGTLRWEGVVFMGLTL